MDSAAMTAVITSLVRRTLTGRSMRPTDTARVDFRHNRVRSLGHHPGSAIRSKSVPVTTLVSSGGTYTHRAGSLASCFSGPASTAARGWTYFLFTLCCLTARKARRPPHHVPPAVTDVPVTVV